MADPTVDLDADTARELARQELADPRYPRATFTDRVSEYINDLLSRIVSKAATVPGGWLTILVLAIVLIAAVIAAVHLTRRTMRTRDEDRLLFDGAELGAVQHRAAAEDCAARGEWEAAIRHRLRALARSLEESGVLAPTPGRTATELAHDAAAAYPGLSGELYSAAMLFNDVSYGEQPGDPDGYRLIARLDDQLRTAPAGAAAGSAPAEAWTRIR